MWSKSSGGLEKEGTMGPEGGTEKKQPKKGVKRLVIQAERSESGMTAGHRCVYIVRQCFLGD